MEEVIVELRQNRRYLENWDTDFEIRGGEQKLLPLRSSKSLVIRQLLFCGDLIVKSGTIEFPYKESMVKIVGPSRIATVTTLGKPTYFWNLEKNEEQIPVKEPEPVKIPFISKKEEVEEKHEVKKEHKHVKGGAKKWTQNG